MRRGVASRCTTQVYLAYFRKAESEEWKARLAKRRAKDDEKRKAEEARRQQEEEWEENLRRQKAEEEAAAKAANAAAPAAEPEPTAQVQVHYAGNFDCKGVEYSLKVRNASTASICLPLPCARWIPHVSFSHQSRCG